MENNSKVSIRPQVTMLSVLKYIEYETWFALAEFIDNAISSYLNNKERLEQIEGPNFQLSVKIELNEIEEKITIKDNAAGISDKDYARAFRAAEIPPDNSGLSEFGMGMKSAACWFSDKWSVTTSPLDEELEKKVTFDMQQIYFDKIEELDVNSVPTPKSSHYTKIELFNVSKIPKKKAVGILKNHLSSIYRDFLRKGILTLKLDTEYLQYTETKVLLAPQYNKNDEGAIEWKKNIDFEIEEGLSVKGFVAIREKASTTHAGFALFRRGRVIQGSYDSGFRPDFIFGHSNSYRYQRIFGELHLEGFNVNFTKKGIQWDEKLDIFLKILKDDISHANFPLFQQAEQFRVRATEKEYQTTKKTLDKMVKEFQEKVPDVITTIVNHQEAHEEKIVLEVISKSINKTFNLNFNRTTWNVEIELSYDESAKELIEIASQTQGILARNINIRVSLAHPFMIEYVGVDTGKLEPVLRMAAILGISEILAKESGIKTQGEVRRNFNELIYNIAK
ncbi:ATP-binding protein [Pedobacter yonginense]|uniref:ATP-binding protein n=1 Tax=Pedobacter yonginense TaxID=651869 RepID=A0A317EMI0_9SPHI|nr:ATP-binding protein [Pedobacter yonginense]PWS27103.1 ATP-binding protein [Pedobacter yonginense]